MGILELIAERKFGPNQLAAHPTLGASLAQAERASRRPRLTDDEKARIGWIIDLCFDYDRETDPAEKAEILHTLEAISSDAPHKAPAKSSQPQADAPDANDPVSLAKAAAEAQRLQAFRKKYFSLRAKLGLETQMAVAEKSGLRRSYIAVIESGDHFPQQKTLQKLAKAFGVDVSDLLP